MGQRPKVETAVYLRLKYSCSKLNYNLVYTHTMNIWDSKSVTYFFISTCHLLSLVKTYYLKTFFNLAVAKQNFEIRVIDEFVLLGNSAIMRCLLPSFVADFVQVSSWLIIDTDESSEISLSQENFGKELNMLIFIKSPSLLPTSFIILSFKIS